MNTIYSRESGSKFPDSPLDMPDMKDIDDSVKDIVIQYYAFMAQGNIDGALALKSSHPELKAYWFDASKLNLIGEEIQNLGIYAKLLRTNAISDTEPEEYYDTGTLWYQKVKQGGAD